MLSRLLKVFFIKQMSITIEVQLFFQVDMKRKMMYQDINTAPNKAQLLAAITTLEQERKQIAQDLHDDISSKLNILSLNCHMLNIPNTPQSNIAEITKSILEYTSKVLDSCKKMSHNLLPPVLEKFGIQAGIEELCSDLKENNAIEVNFENNIKFDFKENDRHIHIFRIIQELIANSINHGKATSISICFNQFNGVNSCNYSDNGIGFDVNRLEEFQGLGIKNISSRILILGGNLSVASNANEGISVVFNF